MAHISRIALFLPALALAAGCGAPREKDDDAPKFSGLSGVVATGPGTAQLGWERAKDRSEVTYRVWTAASPGAEAFDQPPVAETRELSLVLTGLPVGATASYFVVRARDSHGNEETNVTEKAVVFTENRLSLVGGYEMPIASDIAVSTSSDVVAMGSFITDPQIRAWLFDVSDPSQPALLHTIYGEGRSTDVEIRGNVLWVATEDDPEEHGAYSYDISNPADPQPLGSLTGAGLGQCHTIWLDGSLLYCASSDDGEIHLVDVTDPAAPVAKGSIGVRDGRVHDMYIGNGIAVGSFLSDGFAFLDVSDPMNPTLGEIVDYPGAVTHNAWPSADGTHLFTTDETSNGHLRIWDISDRQSIVQVAEYVVDPGPGAHAIVHNVQVVGDYAYIGWYEAGVVVLDVSTPSAPLLVGWHDTWEEPTQGFYAGAWTAAPKPPYIYVSDFTGGLFVMELAP
jgi:hypothetical protein